MQFKKRKGIASGAMLVQILIYCMIAGVITTSIVTLQSSQFSSLSASRVELEAQQWADIKANTVKSMDYGTLSNQGRRIINGSDNEWEDEFIVGAEQIISPDNKQKIVTVNIYKPGESIPKFVLKVPLSSQDGGAGKTPVGTIIIWASWALPSDGKWLICNGQSTHGYPELAAIVGSNVPDYQGYFLRGVGGQSAPLNQTQYDAIRNITGSIGYWNDNNGTIERGAFYLTGRSGTAFQESSGMQWVINFDASRVVPTASENRPLNKAVLYLVRALP